MSRVKEIGRVHDLQGRSNLVGADPLRLCHGQGASAICKESLKGDSLEEFHDDVGRVVLLECGEDPHDARMVEAGKGLAFVDEA